MKILVVGAGGVGGYFGGRLVEFGADVTFLVREGRARQLAEHGLVIKSPVGDANLKVRTLSAADPGEPFGLIILTCKAYDLPSAMDAAAPHMAAGSGLILPLLNGMAHVDTLRERFGVDRVLGGVCGIFATLSPAGEMLHLDKPAIIRFGRFQDQVARGALGPETAAIEKLFAGANFASKRIEPAEQILWEKWLMLATMAGSTCLMRGSVGAILSAEDGTALMEELLAEAISVATAAGFPPSDGHLANARSVLFAKGSLASASMLRDIHKGGKIEGDHIIGDMLRRARAFGLNTPLLRVANAHLQTYEAERVKAAG
jgi:2-dehydropantoate 2-reductase